MSVSQHAFRKCDSCHATKAKETDFTIEEWKCNACLGFPSGAESTNAFPNVNAVASNTIVSAAVPKPISFFQMKKAESLQNSMLRLNQLQQQNIPTTVLETQPHLEKILQQQQTIATGAHSVTQSSSSMQPLISGQDHATPDDPNQQQQPTASTHQNCELADNVQQVGSNFDAQDKFSNQQTLETQNLNESEESKGLFESFKGFVGDVFNKGFVHKHAVHVSVII